MPWVPPPPPVLLTDRFSFIIKLIVAALANRGKSSPVSSAFAVLIYRRICALRNRFFATLARGPIAPRKPRPTPGAKPPNPTLANPTLANPGTHAPLRLPTRMGWLLRLLPQSDAATARGQLIALLDDPEMIALITSHPTIGRALRPLCHLLNIAPLPPLQRPQPIRKSFAPPPPPPPSRPVANRPQHHRPFTWFAAPPRKITP